MKCDFYGQYGISRPASGKFANLIKAQCPRCGAVRSLQKRSGNMWFFPHHEESMGASRETEYLTYAGTGFYKGEN